MFHTLTYRCLTTFLMLVACGCAPEVETNDIFLTTERAATAELAVNGSFANTNNWTLGKWGGSSSGSVVNGEYRLAVTTAGSEWWHVQFMQTGIPLVNGKKYVIGFDAYKGPENTGTQIFMINVGKSGGDYASYFGGGRQVTLTRTKTRVEFTFDMTQPSDAGARIEFNCGRNTGTYYFDNVSLREVEAPAGLVIGAPSLTLSARNTGIASGSLSFENTSASSLAFNISSNSPWLTINPNGGTLVAGQRITATVSASGAGLSIGVHSGALSVTHAATNIPTPTSIPVQFTVVEAYRPESPYLLNPDLTIPFVEEIVAFRNKARDNVNGGYYTSINRQGNPTTENIKSLCAQSRLAYSFVRAFAMTGKESYLDDAHHALKFLYSYGYNNGWLFASNIQGGRISHWGHNDWWSFQQHYALVGISAMVEVTGGELSWGDGGQSDKSWLQMGLDSNYNRLWDNDQLGYFDRASANWNNKWGKGFTPTVDAITTHAELVAMTTELPVHKNRLFQLADNIIDHLVGGMAVANIGFPEVFDTNWNVDTSQTVVDIGHHYKTAWCLLRAYLLDPSRTEYKEAAHFIMWDLWNNGAYDRTYGGPYSKMNWQSGAIVDNGKNDWMLEQGITSGLISHYTASTDADRDMFLEVADGSTSFFMEHQLDPVYGEAYQDVSRDGSSVVNGDKGGLFHAGYHSVETGYYLYLYAHLYYHRTPASLFYKFPAQNQARSIRLTPIPTQDDQLQIAAVELNGAPYTNFNGGTRTLTLPAGTGGVFKVTFSVDGAQAPSCGNGSLNLEETCDDGNTNAGDGCSPSCQLEAFCGDGALNPGEACDDGNTSNSDACLSDCTAARCGDGILWSGVEQCDDANTTPGDGCSPTCQVEPTCADGIKNGQELGVDCGGSCPTCPSTCTPTRYAASSLSYSTGGAVSDGYNIWSNGTGKVNHVFPAGEQTVTVFARGEVAGGSGPHMIVTVGSQRVAQLVISSTTMAAYVFPYSAPSSGSQTITVEFTNDYYSSPQDRNLIIGSVEVGCSIGRVPVCGDGITDPGEQCDDGNTNNADGCLDTCQTATANLAFLEANGLVVMEAEHHDGVVQDKTTGDNWSSISVGSASGGMCMQVGPDSTTQSHTTQSDAQTNSARIGYRVKFASTGSYRIWVRGASTTSNGHASDSCHAGLDGVVQALNMDFPENGSYSWVSGTINVSSAGVHTVQLFMREDGFIADKIILAKSTSYTPSGINQTESARGL